MRALLLALMLPGCVGSFEEARTAAIAQHRAQVSFGTAAARDQHHCDAVDSRHEFFVYTAGGSSFIAGGAGAALGAISDTPGASGYRLGLGIAAGTAGAIAAGATALAASAASEWASDCGSTP